MSQTRTVESREPRLLDRLSMCLQPQVVIIDFGFAKSLRQSAKTFTLCGTPQYLAPEIVTSQGHGFAADWYTSAHESPA